ncbi:Pvc16 family protein [Nocardia sp. NBC_00508]|uniref:Pvc16 family protein n=1 Tax=Nocardia sp. NBC_00508 TaxID=2975992 RepID=UPI002E7FF23B|nr:Pvc16 family protein [Nocardia sp. NBC_00508]WUD66781.1 Pvc16 family protein [Nocardia sp. NBC_00508]
MIGHLDNMIRRLLMARIDGVDDEAQVRFQPPDDAWKQYVATQQKVALNVYLVDLRENRTLRSVERSYQLVGDEMQTGVAPRRVDLHYLITAWSPATPSPAVEPAIDEHDLLYRVAAVLAEAEPIVPRQVYAPAALPAGFPLSIAAAELPTVVLPADGFPKYAEFWGTMGGMHPWRPAVYLRLTVPIEFGARDTAPLVTSQMTGYRVEDGTGADVMVDIGGVVSDADGVPLPLAVVRVEQPRGVMLWEAESNESGRYIFRGLARGEYILRVRAAGFAECAAPIRVPGDGVDYYDVTLA